MRSGTDHTVLSANTPCLPFFVSVRQMVPRLTQVEDSLLLIYRPRQVGLVG